ncbi:hypothetical protein EVAR_43406_1 [Eumeta japonica]|uniref:Uncharacterized protein n=1 Tax=Eumeta variegata TaxID=151549 RepID=A0A4C1WWU8_EUMVA|nr:hypothetical protein EVAR_43406_1 [Eumeta japonica]
MLSNSKYSLELSIDNIVEHPQAKSIRKDIREIRAEGREASIYYGFPLINTINNGTDTEHQAPKKSLDGSSRTCKKRFAF